MERWQKVQRHLGNAPSDDMPVALSAEGPHGPVIHATNRAAHLAGVTIGARVADMRALCPDLKVEFADPEGDRAALQRLGLWARRWCPWTAPDNWQGHGLILDTTGAEHLWGGEVALMAKVEASLSLAGFTARLALAPTWGAAWALARFGPVRAICGDTAPLPVAALRLDDETVLLLNRLGLRSIGQLADLPRLSLARRFSRAGPAQNPLIRLDQMTGHLPEPVSASQMPQIFRADARLAEPIFDPTHHLPGLCAALADQLAKAHQGARRLVLTVYRTDGEVSRIDAACALPSRDPAHLAFLFRDRLERIDPGYGFDLITLEAPVTETLGTPQTDLAGGSDAGVELAHLVDRLMARFGRAALAQIQPVASHIPERAEMRKSPLAGPSDLARPPAERPQRRLDHPEEIRVLYAVPDGPPAQFQWRRRSYRVARYEGPERISPEWWQDRPGTRLRDYFKVEDETGHRFWLYREGLPDDGRGGAPRWFLHGVFA
jgi:protein ImuB